MTLKKTKNIIQRIKNTKKHSRRLQNRPEVDNILKYDQQPRNNYLQSSHLANN